MAQENDQIWTCFPVGAPWLLCIVKHKSCSCNNVRSIFRLTWVGCCCCKTSQPRWSALPCSHGLDPESSPVRKTHTILKLSAEFRSMWGSQCELVMSEINCHIYTAPVILTRLWKFFRICRMTPGKVGRSSSCTLEGQDAYRPSVSRLLIHWRKRKKTVYFLFSLPENRFTKNNNM